MKRRRGTEGEDIGARVDRAYARMKARLDAADRAESVAKPILDRFVETAERALDRPAKAADDAIAEIVRRVRAGEWSRAQLCAIARALAKSIARADKLIEEATSAYEADVREVETWMESVAKAVRCEEIELARQAESRVEHWRAQAEVTKRAMREYMVLRDRLHELGRAVIEMAER